jgi:hypothetical protein
MIVTGKKEYPGKDNINLFQNKPNPFYQSTVFIWQIPVSNEQVAVKNHAVLRINDFMGNDIKTLVDAELTPGEHQVIFDATCLPAGVYFYQLQSNGRVETKKLLVTK